MAGQATSKENGKRTRPNIEASANTTQKWLKHLAGRGPVGTDKGVGAVIEKDGVKAKRLRAGEMEEVFVLGGACSEVFSGVQLANALRPAVEHQQQAIQDLATGKGHCPLSMHTSVGIPVSLGPFLESLEAHLPWTTAMDDWFVNLQLDGATAVWAAVEGLMHLRMAENPGEAPRPIVAVAEKSYHGPKTTALGQPALPRWPGAPRTSGQLAYPAPMEGPGRDPEEATRRFDAFLKEHGSQIGVIVFEPQWGSSAAGLPWPQEVLKEAIRKAKEYGILVLCDEIMCGLGRHGKGTLFLSCAWGLEPDAVTFGKAIACGFPLAGAVIRRGAKLLGEAGTKVQQSHTYAGSSVLALLTAHSVLAELPKWFEHARRMGEVIEEVLKPVNDCTFLEVSGQGLMWGGRFLDPETSRRQEALKIFQGLCGAARVWPYFVPIGGFMLSPPMDVAESDLRVGLQRLADCLKQTQERMRKA